MAIVDDYGAIAKRMRELNARAAKDGKGITEPERWPDTAMDAARAYIQKRKREIVRGPILRRRPQPTD